MFDNSSQHVCLACARKDAGRAYQLLEVIQQSRIATGLAAEHKLEVDNSLPVHPQPLDDASDRKATRANKLRETVHWQE